MRSPVPKASFALVPLLLLAPGVAPAHATFDTRISSTVTPEAGNTFLYTYTVNVLPTSTVPLSEFDLQLTSGDIAGVNTPPGAIISSIAMPSGFTNLYTPGDPLISFLSTDSSTDVPAGSSAVFSFLSASGSASQPYQLAGYDASSNYVTSAGTVVGPVPEPSGVILFGLGALGVAGVAARGRSRKTPASS